MKPVHRYFLLFMLLLVGAPGPLWAQSEPASAMISKVEGSGVAKVRRKSGIESVAGTKQELFSGDRVMTDAKSVVEILLAEGTLVRVGLNSEYRLESVERKNGIMTWVFQLARGSIRALVEKNPKKNMVKFRVNTPVGTMGVRGTELVLEHDQKAKRTTLYTIEGSVEFGVKNCVSRHTCIEVKTGEMASVGEEGGRPLARPANNAVLLFPEGDAADTAKVDGAKATISFSPEQKNQLRSRIALFEDLNKAESLSEDARGIQAIDKGEIDKMVKDASEAMANAQNDLIGRTKEEKEAIHRAIQDGTYEQRLKLAEKFDDIKGGKKTTSQDRAKENLSASNVAKKMTLANAILGSSKMMATLQKRTGLDEQELRDRVDAARTLLQDIKNKTTQPSMDSSNGNAGASSAPANASPSANASGLPPAGAGLPKEVAGNGAGAAAAAPTDAGNVVENAVEALDEPLADAILSDETDEKAWESYSYQKRSCFMLFFCNTETKTVKEATETETKTVERKSGECYETRKNCKRDIIRCDLSKGKYCKAKFTEYQCTDEKTKVTCPGGG